MDIHDAIQKVRTILSEERHHPTVQYHSRPFEGDPSLRTVAKVVGDGNEALLKYGREYGSRSIFEDPSLFTFQSANYELLCALLGRLSLGDRPGFVTFVVSNLHDSPGCLEIPQPSFPSWNGYASDFPLIVEFAARNGGADTFFLFLGNCELCPGLVVLLRHLNDMISVNFAIFSKSDYGKFAVAVQALRRLATQRDVEVKTSRGSSPGQRTRWYEWPTLGQIDALKVYHAIIQYSSELLELCRKADYLYLKSELREGLNLEINQDKHAVEGYLERFGFSAPLVQALEQADRLNRSSASGFELKSSMGHLRSFMESLHAEAIPGVSKIKKVPLPEEKWGAQLGFLRNNGILSKQEDQFVGGLYAVISDEAVHPLIAEREYARLARNVVIEYALLFLSKLEKLGFKKP